MFSDDYVLAQYSVDNQWYRGRIKDVVQHDVNDFSKTVVEVAYFDFGNTEQTSLDRWVVCGRCSPFTSETCVERVGVR